MSIHFLESCFLLSYIIITIIKQNLVSKIVNTASLEMGEIIER